MRNALGAIALVRGLGLSAGEIARALARFEGVRRRMEVKGEKNGILVVDDFAHHPTAVRGTIAAARARFPGRRLWALFEPRSNTAGRKMFEDDYADAFSAADALVVAPVFHAQRLGPDNQLDRAALVARFASARQARLRAGDDRGDPGDPPARGAPGRRAAAHVLGGLRRPARVAARKPVTPRVLYGALAFLALVLFGSLLFIGAIRADPGVAAGRADLEVLRQWVASGVLSDNSADPSHLTKAGYLLYLRAALPHAGADEGENRRFLLLNAGWIFLGWPRRQARSGGDSGRPHPCFSCSGSWHVRPCATARTT